jgi:hypothetical protein
MHFLFLVLIPGHQGAASSSSLGNNCVPELTDISYPAEALRQRVVGFVSVEFKVGADGRPTEIETKGYPLLAAGLAPLLDSIELPPACAGNRVALSVRYTFDNETKPGSPIALHKLSAGRYEVVAPAEIIEINTLDPAWMFSRRKRILHKIHTALAAVWRNR